MQVATRLIQAMVTVAAVLLAESAALAQAIVPTNSAPNPYRAIENWAKLPEGRTWGSTNAVDIDRAMDEKQALYSATRATKLRTLPSTICLSQARCEINRY
jgi:hypothetical protein